MASTLCCRASLLVSSNATRRRFQLVASFSTLSSSSSSYLKTGCVQSLPFVPSNILLGFLFRSKFSTRAPDKTVPAVKMEASSNTVPSIVVYVTVPNRDAGRKLADSIVKEKLAACVNIVPGVESVYEWEGKVNRDPEELLIIKTRQSLLPALTEHVKANHEYDVPEVIALPIGGGSAEYLEWLKNSTRE
ncbi:protein CutA, chloroplastic-like [Gossypium australe]|uniref:Protein CutA, chloroplastic-like n=1 Tax=Gossypium australe TaxID=47621 RepID=A0A5B6UCM0_9ROSI|nr:protein CutA, chloroplastic-like [Gossypium australe]